MVLAGWVARDHWYVEYGYPYCYYSYYYYYGCWAPSYSYVYSIPTGALLVDLAVVDESASGEFESAWTFAIRGMLSTSAEVSPSNRITRGINQAFRQSPYLSEGGEK